MRGTCFPVLAAILRLWVTSGVFDCPAFQGIRAGYNTVFEESAGSMQLFMWHRDQKAVSGCLSAILNEAENVNTDPSS